MTAPQTETVGRTGQAEKARRRICRAVIACLDRFGYNETSLGRVQNEAGISRGALTHHFPTKEDMMVATLRQILEPVRFSGARTGRAAPVSRPMSVHAELVRLWTETVDTVEGRALFEILVAARTDSELESRIKPSLVEYNDELGVGVLAIYRSRGRNDDDDVRTLWTICRVFLRGLHVQERFGGDRQTIGLLMERFADLISGEMVPRERNGNAQSVRE
jgi:AcrR family transcriptional regulator